MTKRDLLVTVLGMKSNLCRSQLFEGRHPSQHSTGSRSFFSRIAEVSSWVMSIQGSPECSFPCSSDATPKNLFSQVSISAARSFPPLSRVALWREASPQCIVHDFFPSQHPNPLLPLGYCNEAVLCHRPESITSLHSRIKKNCAGHVLSYICIMEDIIAFSMIGSFPQM